MKNDMLLIVYVDDSCLISPNEASIIEEINSLQKDYDLTDDGPLKDYLGTRLKRHNDGKVILTQPAMIEMILKLVRLDTDNSRTKLHNTPADKVLDQDPQGKPREQKWHYRSVVGCLEYLQSMVRPDLTVSV